MFGALVRRYVLAPQAPHLLELVDALRNGDVLVVEPPDAPPYVCVVIVSRSRGTMLATPARGRAVELLAASHIDNRAFVLAHVNDVVRTSPCRTVASVRRLRTAPLTEGQLRLLLSAFEHLRALEPDTRARRLAALGEPTDYESFALAAALSSSVFALVLLEAAEQAHGDRTKRSCDYDVVDWLDDGDVPIAFEPTLVVDASAL